MNTIFIEEVTGADKFYFVNESGDDTFHISNQSRYMAFKTVIEYIRFLNSIGIKVDYSHVDTDIEHYVLGGS